MGWSERIDTRFSGRSMTLRCGTFWFMRHGQTVENQARICQGQRDVPLSDAGIMQAENAARLLRKQKLSGIVASDLERARMTYESLLDHIDLEVRRDRRLRERAFGIHEGKTAPKHLWDSEAEGVERIEDFADRVAAAIVEVLDRDDLLLVAHGGILRIILLLVAVPARHWAFSNALPIRFVRKSGHWSASALTNHGHIPIDNDLPLDVSLEDTVTSRALQTGPLG